MASENHKTIARRVPQEIYNQGKLSVADEIFAADYVEHTPLPPGFPSGVQAVKTYVILLRAAFPDFVYTIDDEIAEGDKVVLCLTARGTQTGEFMGIPATGRNATWTETHVCRIANDRLVEHWVNADQLGMMQQLGVIPVASAAIG